MMMQILDEEVLPYWNAFQTILNWHVIILGGCCSYKHTCLGVSASKAGSGCAVVSSFTYVKSDMICVYSELLLSISVGFIPK